jgi:hypothetical protein
MKPNNKLSHQQGNLSASEQQHAASRGAQDFADSDDLLRLDAAQTIVPPKVAQRLQKSLGGVSVKSWWQKLLGL